MKKVFLGLVALVLMTAGCASTPSTANYGGYGDPVVVVRPMPLSQAIADVEAGGPRDVLVEAEIAEVCEKMGCWMIVKDGAQKARVRFTASETCTAGFYVPRNANGHRTFVQGRLEAAEVPEDWARHYAEDQGASPAEIAKIIGPQREYTLIAKGVLISEKDLLDPPVDQMPR